MKDNRKSLSIAFVVLLALVVLITLMGQLTARQQPLTLQGEVEATEIRISGKLLGRIDSFLVREGEAVRKGDTLVVINSPIVEAQYRKTEALHQAAMEETRKAERERLEAELKEKLKAEILAAHAAAAAPEVPAEPEKTPEEIAAEERAGGNQKLQGSGVRYRVRRRHWILVYRGCNNRFRA